MLMTKKRMKHRQSSINSPDRKGNQHRLDEQIDIKSVLHVNLILQNDHEAENSDGRPKSNQKNIREATDAVRA